MKSLGCTSPDLDRGYQASPWHVPPKYLTSFHPRQNPYVQADLFTVIRNPYSRFVSEFHCPWMGIQSSGGQLRIAMFGNTTTTALSTVQKADYILNPDIMNVWIQWKVTQIHTAIQEVKKKGPKGTKGMLRAFGSKHFINQVEYVYDGDKVIITNIVQYENLASDFQALMDTYNLNITLPATAVNTGQVHATTTSNVTNRLSYRDLYPETIARINEYAKPDFQKFGYQMVDTFEKDMDYSLNAHVPVLKR